ncbi:MAG: Crp/Fnr family transcriptional regulator [Verrucomicrobiota bacterium]|nr:Crp/Fnr family transcriptional regulator [Verrucomicrobiota bacterium]
MNPLLSLFESEPTITIAEGEEILSEGKPVDTLYVLIAGDVEILKGTHRVNIITEPGSIFGEMSYLLNKPATATVRAMKYSCFYKVDAGFAWSHPEIYRHVAVQLSIRLAAITDYLSGLETKLSSEGKKSRVAEEISDQLRRVEDIAFKNNT